MDGRLKTFFSSMVLGILLIGCGGQPGVDAESVVDPEFAKAQKNLPGPDDVLRDLEAKLKRGIDTPAEAFDPGKRIRFIRNLAVVGKRAEFALPTLEELAANDPDEDVKKEAQLAIDKIKAASDG